MELHDLPQNKKIILFDGVCNLCDSSVQFIIKKDKKDIFRFVALQSELGITILKHIGISRSNYSIVLYEPGEAYYHKAEAVLKIGKTFGGLYTLLSVFSFLPKVLNDTIYDYIAKNRYKWYGKKESCMMPTPELSDKFL